MRFTSTILVVFCFVSGSASASGPVQTAGWTADGGQENALFGHAIASAGDVNGDGFSEVLVGSDQYSNPDSNEGRASLFLGSAGGPEATASWALEGEQAGAHFGSALSGAGDVNGDGYDDVIVGAFGYSNGQDFEGRAYAYHGSASGLATTPAWVAESNQQDAVFGWSVSGAGDVNGDGYDDVIVGAKNYSNGQSFEGRAYVYHGSASGLATTHAWLAESNQQGAVFGWSVAGAGDVNADGYDDVIVGARYSNGQSFEGRAYVYHGSAAGLATTYSWVAESNQAGAVFGDAVAGAGDVNGDGYDDVIVGAPNYTNEQSFEGRAFVYLGSMLGLDTTPHWFLDPTDQANAVFGWAVGSADFEADGFSDAIVGAKGLSNGESFEGGAYVYAGSDAGLAPTPVWTADGDQEFAEFGYAVAGGSVAADGADDLIVGAQKFTSLLPFEGRALVFFGIASIPVPGLPAWAIALLLIGVLATGAAAGRGAGRARMPPRG